MLVPKTPAGAGRTVRRAAKAASPVPKQADPSVHQHPESRGLRAALSALGPAGEGAGGGREAAGTEPPAPGGSSILGSEDLREPFLSLLLVLTEIDFSLDLQNCSFLDESWLLPVRARRSWEPSFCHLALPEKSNEGDKEGFGGEGLPRTLG
ncbi:hypothetical protein DV515_00009963 [Chloebia gouldiae]|uniref:Uncharacterized protein n=1 Tax=Chloebia gouldiae TaxID=44316 RepID=A0A3L8SA89_CHLGU|nr:hypothetical protein DV515_00009963 [Chloebia gouldiae]